MTAANFKFRILTYVNTIIKNRFFNLARVQIQQGGVSERIIDLQLQALYCITKVVKYLHEQTDQAIEFFEKNKLGIIDLENTVGESKKIEEGAKLKKKASGNGQEMAPEDSTSSGLKRATLPIESIFVMQEQDIVDAYNDSFAVSWRTISQIEDFRRTHSTNHLQDQQALRTALKNLQVKKEWIIKTAKQAFFTLNFI